MYNNDFDRRWNKAERDFNLFRLLFKIVFPVVFLLAIAKVVATGYVAVKYGPRYLEAGARVLEKIGDR